MRTLFQDLRYSIRQLLKLPGFSLTAILSLALGIGATTAVFSVVYAILMDPYPYAAPDRMIHMRLLTPKGDLRGFGLTGTQWQQLRKSPVVEDTFLEDDWSLTVTGSDVPEDVQGVYFTSNTFNFFGVPAALGRGLQPSDAVDGQDPQPVVVLGYKFWQRHFNSDPAVLGKTIQLVRKNYTVVGVAASRFTWGDGDVYLPLKVTQDQVRGYYAGIRLKPGVTHAQADAALQPLIAAFAKETPTHFPHDQLKLHVVGLNEDFIKQLGGTLYLLFGAVALLLLIGCGNVSILQLARATSTAARICGSCSNRRKPQPHHPPAVDRGAAALNHRRGARSLARLQVACRDRSQSSRVFLPARSGHPDQSAGSHFLRRDCRRNGRSLRALAGVQLSRPEVSQVMQIEHAQDNKRRERAQSASRR